MANVRDSPRKADHLLSHIQSGEPTTSSGSLSYWLVILPTQQACPISPSAKELGIRVMLWGGSLPKGKCLQWDYGGGGNSSCQVSSPSNGPIQDGRDVPAHPTLGRQGLARLMGKLPERSNMTLLDMVQYFLQGCAYLNAQFGTRRHHSVTRMGRGCCPLPFATRRIFYPLTFLHSHFHAPAQRASSPFRSCSHSSEGPTGIPPAHRARDAPLVHSAFWSLALPPEHGTPGIV